MLFNPPKIENIKQVLPIVKDNPAFVVKDKGWYTVIDYVYMANDLFHDPIERECRGLKFCSKTGKILARPFHKFHNLGEREAFMPDKVDLRNPHSVLEKLDGSMVHTCASELGIYLMTRMGHTEQAQQAEKFLEANQIKYSRLFNTLSVDDYTYVFEYIGPNNKIVLSYPEEQLVLTAIRHNVNGTYLFHDELQAIAIPLGIPVVGEAIDSEYKGKLSIDQLNDSVKLASGAEGVVVRFDTGEMIKIKADEYCRRHASKELASSFKGLVGTFVDNTLDDIYPQLEEPQLSDVKTYINNLNTAITNLSSDIDIFIVENQDLEQKEFALEVQKQRCKALWPILFDVRKGFDTSTGVIIKSIGKNVSTNTKLTEYFTALQFPIWSYDFFGNND